MAHSFRFDHAPAVATIVKLPELPAGTVVCGFRVVEPTTWRQRWRFRRLTKRMRKHPPMFGLDMDSAGNLTVVPLATDHRC